MRLPSGIVWRRAMRYFPAVSDDAAGAVDLLGEASNAVDAAAQLDPALTAAAGQLLDLYYNAKDVAADLIGRLDTYDTNDAELDEVEQRLDLFVPTEAQIRQHSGGRDRFRAKGPGRAG